MTHSFVRARATIAGGDLEGLARLLDVEPALATARWPGEEVPYDGYFHRATLLHHVSGNPLESPVPDNAVDLALLLVDRGAEVDAVTAQGPSQPNDVGWTTLGLVATSGVAREAGVQRALLDALVERGADVDARNGGALVGALYYGEREAAARLVEHGADVDMVAAAGLGRLDLVDRHVGADGTLSTDAHRLVHYGLVPLPPEETLDHVLSLALVYAAKGGHVPVLERLVDLGGSVDSRPPFDHRATLLHWAVLGDQPDAVRWLLRNGADAEARDTSFHSTPLGWARHLGRPACGAILEAR